MSITLEEYADAKGLQTETLRDFGLTDFRYMGEPAIRIPYLDERQEVVATRIRLSLDEAPKFMWPNGTKAKGLMYGLDRLGGSSAVALVEGESDCHTLWAHSFSAIGLPGARMWDDDLHVPHLSGCEVVYAVIEPDSGGERLLDALSRSSLVERVQVIQLDGQPDPSAMYIADPGTFPECWLQLVDAAVPITRFNTHDRPSSDVAGDAGDGLASIPRIVITDKHLKDTSAEAIDALVRANGDSPTLFRYGDALARLRVDENGTQLEPLTRDSLRGRLDRVADWQKLTKDGYRPARPPMDVVRDIASLPSIKPIPSVTRVVAAPVFAPDGSLLTDPGYNAGARLFYAPSPSLHLPDVPARPTKQKVDTARRMIVDELLVDFPFVSEAERAHAIALLLLPFCRDLIAGHTPLHLFEAPSPGTGKTLLVHALTYPASGRPPPQMTECRSEEEWRKRITAKVAEGPSVFVIDNLQRRLDSAALSSLLTTDVWEDRLLGQSKMVRFPVRAAFAATGNNPSVSNELARRTVRIRLDSGEERPWVRGGFRHENLMTWAAAYRAELVWAALTLVQAWIVEGRPSGTAQRLGMFEDWSDVIGGILEVTGISGFLTNTSEFYQDADIEAAAAQALVQVWWDRFTYRPVGVTELWPIAPLVIHELLDEGNEHGARVKFGNYIKSMRDRRYTTTEGVTLRVSMAEMYQGAQRWKLQEVRTEGAR